jgi:hypothetical protein
LIGAIEVALESDPPRLRIIKGQQAADALVEELNTFVRTISASGMDQYNAAGSNHDDLVVALGLALWWAERSPLAVSASDWPTVV